MGQVKRHYIELMMKDIFKGYCTEDDGWSQSLEERRWIEEEK